MEFISLFDVIGPNMIGPSSSHTAGACAIGLMAARLFRKPIKKVTFTLFGSFSRTYRGHGTDRALLGGILGMEPDDPRIRDSFDLANMQGLQYEFIIDTETETPHPNTAEICMEGDPDLKMTVRGESVGGGKIIIDRIDEVDVSFSGEYHTLIVYHPDQPGILESIIHVLSRHQINIAFMKVFSTEKRISAITVIESDTVIPIETLKELKSLENVHRVIFVPGRQG